MKVIAIILALVCVVGCATRRKVFFNKTTGERWVTVDNSSEFLTDNEKEFFKIKKQSGIK